MSEATNEGFPRIQHSFFCVGDQTVFRADTGEEFKKVVQGFAENLDDITKAINSIKQLYIANGILTGDSQNKGAAPTSKATPSKPVQRASDSPPPSGDVPNCDKHGKPMKDFADRNYKHRYYCPMPRGQNDGCNPKD